jgi:hypothetical protein
VDTNTQVSNSRIAWWVGFRCSGSPWQGGDLSLSLSIYLISFAIYLSVSLSLFHRKTPLAYNSAINPVSSSFFSLPIFSYFLLRCKLDGSSLWLNDLTSHLSCPDF